MLLAPRRFCRGAGDYDGIIVATPVAYAGP
jgi:hypothetical protein